MEEVGDEGSEGVERIGILAVCGVSKYWRGQTSRRNYIAEHDTDRIEQRRRLELRFVPHLRT
jgi:hypothetical protein